MNGSISGVKKGRSRFCKKGSQLCRKGRVSCAEKAVSVVQGGQCRLYEKVNVGCVGRAFSVV